MLETEGGRTWMGDKGSRGARAVGKYVQVTGMTG
jgi:hypothetical protein